MHLCRHQKQAIFKNNSVLQTFASISKIYVQFLKVVLQSLTVFIGFHNPFSYQQYYPARTIFGQFAALNELSTLAHFLLSGYSKVAEQSNVKTLKKSCRRLKKLIKEKYSKFPSPKRYRCILSSLVKDLSKSRMTSTGYLELIHNYHKTSSVSLNVVSGNCYLTKVFCREIVFSRNFFSQKCFVTKLFLYETVFSRNCLLTKLLPHETATSPKGLSRTVSSRNCFPTKLFLHKLSILPKPFPRRNDR